MAADELTYSRLLLGARESFGGTLAFVDEAGRDTFDEHVDRTLRLRAAHLSDAGISPTSPFAVLADSSRHYANLWHVAMLGGGVIVPLNTRYAPQELAFVLNQCAAQLVYVDEAHLEALLAVLGQAPAIRQVVLLSQDHVGGMATVADLIQAGEPVVSGEPADDAPSVILYTSGTTGRPKGVTHSSRGQTLNAYRVGMALAAFGDDVRFLFCNPMFHAGAASGTLAVPAAGGTTVIHPRFDPARVLRDIYDFEITHIGLVPTMVSMLLQDRSFDPARAASLRRLMYGAAPMPGALLERLRNELPDVELVQVYGMTEAGTAIAALSDADHRRGNLAAGTVGKALPGVLLRIEDPAGKPVDVGSVGEICVQAGSVMLCYHNDLEQTQNALRGGWYHTGDLGFRDESGYLHLVDRANDLIISGGENVYPTEVENAIAGHPAVLRTAVIGLPDDHWGEVVHAVVQLRDGMVVSTGELQAHVRTQLAGYKVPKVIHFRTEPLPLSGAMKVLRNALRQEYGAPRAAVR